MKQCETCGKELKHSQVFTVNGKVQCEECANSAPCGVCGKMLKQDEKCHKDGMIICRDCFKNIQKEAASNLEGESRITINKLYEDDVMKYIMRFAQTTENNKKTFREALLAAVILAAMAAFNFFFGLKVHHFFTVVAEGFLLLTVISIVVAVIARFKRSAADDTIYQNYYNTYRHPVFGNADTVQKVVNEIRSHAVYADEEIAISKRFLILRNDLTAIWRLEDIIGVTNNAVSEHTGSFTRYLILFDRYGKTTKVRYVKHADDRIASAVSVLSDCCYNALCVSNPHPLSKKLPERVTKYVAEFRKKEAEVAAAKKEAEVAAAKKEAEIAAAKEEARETGKLITWKQYELEDVSRVKKLLCDEFDEYRCYRAFSLAARDYSWEKILEWADYMAAEDLKGITKVTVGGAIGSVDADLSDRYHPGDRFSDMEELRREHTTLSICGISETLGTAIIIEWTQKLPVLRIFTREENEEKMVRYIETLIRRTFHTEDAMKLAKPVELSSASAESSAAKTASDRKEQVEKPALERKELTEEEGIAFINSLDTVYVMISEATGAKYPSIDMTGFAWVFSDQKSAMISQEKNRAFHLAYRAMTLQDFKAFVNDWYAYGVYQFRLNPGSNDVYSEIHRDHFAPNPDAKMFDYYGSQLNQSILRMKQSRFCTENKTAIAFAQTLWSSICHQLYKNVFLVPVAFDDEPDDAEDNILHCSKNAVSVINEFETKKLTGNEYVKKAEVLSDEIIANEKHILGSEGYHFADPKEYDSGRIMHNRTVARNSSTTLLCAFTDIRDIHKIFGRNVHIALLTYEDIIAHLDAKIPDGSTIDGLVINAGANELLLNREHIAFAEKESKEETKLYIPKEEGEESEQ